MAEVITLNISDDFAKKVKDADSEIKKLVTTTENAKNVIIQHFKEMGDMGVGHFIQKINEASQSISKLGTIQINSNGTAKAIDDINLLINAMTKLSESQLTSLSNKQNSSFYKQLLNDAKEYRNILDEIGRKLIRQNKQNISEHKIALEQEKTYTMQMIAAEKEKQAGISRTIAEVKRLAQAYKAMPTSLTSKNVGKIVAQTMGASTINQHLTAISNLKTAIKDLDTGQKNYQATLNKLNSEIARHKAELEKLGVGTDNVRNKQSNLMDTAGQLKRQLAGLFSISAIQGYMNKLVGVRKEFELQQRSLQVLLQSKDQADKLWNQTLDLAVKSPFRVKELVSYTKQLAAYRIETDKLHDTTKRLADVSAGLGVDMQRLILAFGQVSAANFLRGTELRQFTEAGIPMLDELAKYFTELEGRMVSAGDVFERISKRMVSFSDVEEVFRRMTDAGGVFFNMQEEQSKTLAGMISNLHDSIDLMFNEIGSSYDGLLKGSVNFAKFFVENWELMGAAIKGVLLALSSYKLYQLAAKDAIIQTAVAQGVLNSQGVKQLSLIQLLNVGWNKLTLSIKNASASFKAFMAFNIPLMAITAAISAIWELTSAVIEHENALKDITKQYDELRKKVESINVKFNIATQDKDIKTQKAKLKELVDLANNDYNLNIKVNIEGLSSEQVQNKFTEISTQIFDANIFSEHFAKQMQKATEWVVEDDIFEDFNQLGEEANNTLNNLALNRERIVFNLQKQQDSLNDSQKQALKFLEQPKKIDESEVEYLERLRSGYSILIEEYVQYKDKFHKAATLTERSGMYENLLKMQKTLSEIGVDANKISSGFFDLDQSLQEAQREFLEFANTINLDKNLSQEQKEIRLKAAIDKLASQKNWNDFVKNYIGQWTKEPFGVTISFTPKKETKELEDWQKRVNKAVGDLNQRMKEAIPDLPDNMLFPLTKAGEQLNEYLNTAKSRLDEINTKFTGGQQIYDQWTVGLLNAQKEFAPIYQDIINLHKNATSGAGKDWFSGVINGIQDAHKEYIKLNKTLDATESKQLTLKKYSELFSDAVKNAKLGDISLGDLNFETEQVVIDALTMLKDKLPKDAKDAHFKIEQALSDIVGEVRIKTKIESDKELVDSIEEMFGNYEVSLELEKLNIPPDLAKQLFNIDALTLPELKSKVVSMESKFVGTDMEEEYRKFLKKIDEMEENAQMERLKKYSKYLVQAQSERVKIKLEEMRQLAEIEKLGFNETQKEQITQSIQLETKQKMDKAEWEAFKDTDLYVQMFEDLGVVSDKVLIDLKTRLIDIRGSLSDLSPRELKEVVSQLEKVTSEQISRNPFENLGDTIDKGVKALKRLNQEQEEYSNALKEQDVTQKRVDSLQIANKQAEAQIESAKAILLSKDATIEQRNEAQHIITTNKGAIAQNNLLLDVEIKRLATQKGITEEAAKKLILTRAEVSELNKTANSVGAWGSTITDSVSQVTSMLENWGIDFGEEFEGVLSGLGQAFGALENIDLTKPMSVISGVTGVVAGLGNAFASIFGFGNKDKKKEKQIQREIKFVEDLERAYEKMEKQIDKAYEFDTLKGSYDAAQKNIDAQIDSYEKMIAAEEAKKKTDKDRIKELELAIEDLKEKQREMLESQVEELGGGYDYSSMTEDFVNAWLDAFKETGDGLSGLADNFEDFWQNIAIKQAVMGGASKIMQPFLDAVNKALENDFNLDDSEMANIEQLGAKAKEDVNAFLEQWYDRWGDFMTQGEQSELSGLQRGIQELTESTGQEIAAYLNSIRFFVAEQTTYLSQIASSFGNTEMENPMVGQLRIIAQQTTAINTLLQSLTRGGHTLGGVGLKVFIS